MKSQVASLFQETWLTSGAMVLFFVVFIVMLMMVLNPKAKKMQRNAEQVPLDDFEEKQNSTIRNLKNS